VLDTDRRVENLLRSQGGKPARRPGQLLLVPRPVQSALPAAGRDHAGDTAADRTLRLGPLPAGHPPCLPSPDLGRAGHHLPGVPRQPESPRRGEDPAPARARPGPAGARQHRGGRRHRGEHTGMPSGSE
jgi:hypothetical protein